MQSPDGRAPSAITSGARGQVGETGLQAVIIAGGKGERLRPFTDDRPKPMVEVLGIPILAYQIHWLVNQGVRRIVLSCGYRHEVIQDYFGHGEKWGIQIAYAVEDEPLGRGGGLKLAWQHLLPGDEPVLGTNGDVITSFDLAPLLADHRQSGATGTIVLAQFTSPYGIVDLDDAGRVSGFREKPVLPYWINAGVYVFSRDFGELLPDRGDHEVETFPQLAEAGKLRGYRIEAFWRAVDTVKDLSEVRAELERRLIASFVNGGAPVAGRR